MRGCLIILALLAAGCSKQPQEAANDAEPVAQVGPVQGLDRSKKGTPAPDAAFKNPDGGEISLAQFKGNPVLLNLWATWCAPCVKELPTLDRLQAKHEHDGQFSVLTVSQDMGPQPSVAAFLAKLKLTRIGSFHDPKMALSGALNAEVLPTSVLFDAEGREVWRYVGDLDWSGAEAAKLLAEGGVEPS
jgi:thiol-disulfide isomerase/thioredoxin